MSFEALARRNQAEVNARMADEGRCYMHNTDVGISARYLLELPIGNVLPLCVECCAWWRKDAAETGDPMSQPVRITEIEPPDTPGDPRSVGKAPARGRDRRNAR